MSENFYNISFDFDEKLAQVVTDQALRSFLKEPGNQSLRLADHLLSQYQTIYDKSLMIARDSIAIEILAHVYADSLSHELTKILLVTKSPLLPPAIKMLQKISNRTEIIDIGERSIDSDRHIWDSLVPFCKQIYGFCGQNKDVSSST